MASTALSERYAPNLHGVLSYYDRIIVTGTLADAILDRVVHSSHKIALKGVSLRDPEQDK